MVQTVNLKPAMESLNKHSSKSRNCIPADFVDEQSAEVVEEIRDAEKMRSFGKTVQMSMKCSKFEKSLLLQEQCECLGNASGMIA